MAVIAADVGGSKSLLGWFPTPGSAAISQYYDNHAYPDFDAVLQDFLGRCNLPDGSNITLSVAIAGPVVEHRQCQMTNLSWQVDTANFQHRFRFTNAVLLNDLEATALAMPGATMQTHLTSIGSGNIDFTRKVAVVSVGTGLGEALLLPAAGSGYHTVLPSEGGHKSFAPFDTTGVDLLQAALRNGTSAVSWEDWFSGSGLPQLYHAMFPQDGLLSSAQITQLAELDQHSHASLCIQFFTRGLFAEAANIALQYWCDGGVILAGGVAQHVKRWLLDKDLQQPFVAKSRHQAWLAQLPLLLCTNVNAALQGAADYGWQLDQKKRHGIEA